MVVKIQSVLQEDRSFAPNTTFQKWAYISSREQYQKMWDASIEDPEEFWGRIAEDFIWFKKWNRVRSYDWKHKIDIQWFEGAKTNITVNCLDRHVDAGLGKRTAI